MPAESLQKDKLYRELGVFLIKLLLIWLSWKLFSWVIGEEKTPINERLFPALSLQWELFCNWLRKILLFICDFILHLLGYKTQLVGSYILRVEGYGGVALGNYCLGLQLIYYISMLIVISRIPVSKKIAGIIMGFLFVQILNILRITGLILIDVHAHHMMFLSHDYLFSIPVAGILLWYYGWLTKRKNRLEAKKPVLTFLLLILLFQK